MGDILQLRAYIGSFSASLSSSISLHVGVIDLYLPFVATF